jgi:integrase/recombinase XerD
MPTHHNLDHYLEEYISAAGIAEDRKGSTLPHSSM